MSLADPFVALGHFGSGEVAADLPDCTPGPGGWDNGAYVGPFTLEQAMQIYWNLESVTCEIVGSSVTLHGNTSEDPAPVPWRRVSGYAGFGNIGQPKLIVRSNQPYYHVSDGGYYFLMDIAFLLGIEDSWMFTISTDAPNIGDWVRRPEYEFTTNLFWILNVPVFVYSYASWPFTSVQSLVLTPSYYTYS